ncbi:PREDICTED: nuclear envelope phosphatase-regulatory subunit 1 [Myotis davidii]|nr:PREDICTED: nuclear envelope phosphatase-regulatory subunit 1 [Myotis davidii]
MALAQRCYTRYDALDRAGLNARSGTAPHPHPSSLSSARQPWCSDTGLKKDRVTELQVGGHQEGVLSGEGAATSHQRPPGAGSSARKPRRQSLCLDLKAFERRLTEYIHCLQPATGRWRMLLIVVSVCTATGAWNWLIDPETQKVSFLTSLWNHPFFTISCITLIGLFFAGIHKRVVAPSIIAARCRTILAEYNMSCDDTGKLILKPRPHVQ